MASANTPTASSSPIPIPNTHPTTLIQLIYERKWTPAIHRCHTHPHEVGSASRLRNDRGYTALHTLMAYNQSVAGEELVLVIKAILKAADEIEYGSEYILGGGNDDNDDEGNVEDESKFNTNEIVEGDDGDTTTIPTHSGSWRLLHDQENKARWSPLHLTCVHGGITFGKTAVLKALLQMDNENENKETTNQHVSRRYKQQQQQKALTLLDRQSRNLLHHLLSSLIPSHQAFGDVSFLLTTCPSLLFQKDGEENTPLAYVVERMTEAPGSSRRHYIDGHNSNEGDGFQKNYEMLRLLVNGMERETRGWGHAMDWDEERKKIDIVAPPGKLGVVLFTREPPAPRGPAYVSDIRDDSPLKEKICIGDRVIAVDGRDVREMTSTEASALLASKSERGERKITILRKEVVDDVVVDDNVNHGGGDDLQLGGSAATTVVGDDSLSQNSKSHQTGQRNVLQCACLLPKRFCPPDGSLLTYLSSEKASQMESKVGNDNNDGTNQAIRMVAERDLNGNSALHLFLFNRSYAVNEDNGASSDKYPEKAKAATTRSRRRDAATATPSAANDLTTEPQSNAEYKIIKSLLDSNHETTASAIASLPNDRGRIPLSIAMKCGRRQAVALLVLEHPQAVLLDDTMDNHVFVHILGCISIPQFIIMGNTANGNNGASGKVNDAESNANDEERLTTEIQLKCFATMFKLLRACPDIVSSGGSDGERRKEKLGMKEQVSIKKKRWWKKLYPF